jgi:two-component system LytT family response regulator
MMRAVLVDDEPLARERLRTLLEGESDISLVGECGDGASAVDTIEREAPDLLFLDIQMPELDGFEVIQAIATPPPAVIFVTAYDTFALRAFEVAAVDYLLKPIDPERFHVALERARARFAGLRATESDAVKLLIDHIHREQRGPQRFVVRMGSKVSFVRADDVEWIEADGNYAKLFARGRVHLVRETMNSIEGRLDATKFVRVHRSVIVQVDAIASMEPHLHGEWEIRMRDGSRFTSSRTHSDRVRELMR